MAAADRTADSPVGYDRRPGAGSSEGSLHDVSHAPARFQAVFRTGIETVSCQQPEASGLDIAGDIRATADRRYGFIFRIAGKRGLCCVKHDAPASPPSLPGGTSGPGSTCLGGFDNTWNYRAAKAMVNQVHCVLAGGEVRSRAVSG
jgi:hypothetical protein